MCGQICMPGAFPLRPYVYLTQRTHRLKATISHAKGSGAMQKVHTWQPHLFYPSSVLCCAIMELGLHVSLVPLLYAA